MCVGLEYCYYTIDCSCASHNICQAIYLNNGGGVMYLMLCNIALYM